MKSIKTLGLALAAAFAFSTVNAQTPAAKTQTKPAVKTEKHEVKKETKKDVKPVAKTEKHDKKAETKTPTKK